MKHNKLQRPHILIVDDDSSITLLLAAILKDTYEISTASDGRKAICSCRKAAPDLVLLDVTMPGHDGYEVCRRLKANAMTANVPVILMTANDSPDDEIKAFEAGAVDFLLKPLRAAVVLARVRIHITLKQQADELRELALTDALTGIANRRRFDEALESEWRRCRRSRVPVAAIMVDIDHFKRYNDAYGHAAGDACLKQLASALRNVLRRPGDLLARYGGEEFICLLPETGLEPAANRADHLGHVVQQLNIAHSHSSAAGVVTVSRGVSAAVPTAGIEPSDLLQMADAMLYAAKRAGRNRTISRSLDMPKSP